VTENKPEQGKSEHGKQEKPATKPGESLSLFVTRILDQLSLSSWLPAIMLICNLALILQLHHQQDFDLSRAITSLTAKPLGILIVLTLAIIVASIVTQAFEFEVIRLLEGYWDRIRLLRGLSAMRTRRHVCQYDRLQDQYRKVERLAYFEARDEMPAEAAEIWDKLRRNAEDPLHGYDPELVANVKDLGWECYASPERLRHIDAVSSLLEEFPEQYRILPTRLGNTLRSTEDQLPLDDDENLEDFINRRYDFLSSELKVQHDQFRSRLDIYCMLTLIFILLAMASPVALIHHRDDLIGASIFSAVYAILSCVSYQAAIASARGYVSVLRVIGSKTEDL
jgi:hypothetical protein